MNRKLLLFFGWFWVGFSGKAQFPVPWHYSTEDGLPSSMIYRGTEDNDGYIWFVTDRGVSRFDGYNFKRFTLADGLTSNDVWGVEAGDDGRLWFSTFNEPMYFENEKFKTVRVAANSLKPKKVENYRFDSKGAAYFEDLHTQYKVSPVASDSFILERVKTYNFLTKDSLGVDWFYDLQVRSHLKICNKKDCRESSYSLDLSNDYENFIAYSPIELPGGTIFSGREKFIYFDFKGVEIRDWDSVLPEGVVVVGVYKFTKNSLLINSTLGYFVLDKNLNIIEGFNFLNNYNLNYAFSDSQGNIWLCTRDDGVYFLTAAGLKSKTFTSQKENLSDDILKLSFDPHKRLCAGSGAGNLYIFKDEKLIDFDIQFPPALSSRMLGLEVTDCKAVLMGGDFGFAAIRPDPKKPMYFDLSEPTIYPYNDLEWNTLYNCYLKALELHEGSIYLGHRSGVSRFEITEDNVMKHQLIEKNSSPTYALSATDAGVWIGKKEGLFYWSKNTSEVISKGEEHPAFNYPVNAMATDSLGNLWMGTDGFGVFRYSASGKVDTILELKNSIARSMHIEGTNPEIWIAHNNGVSFIKVSNDNPFQYEHRLINRSHGLPSNEVNDVMKLRDSIFVASKNGLTILDYSNVFSNEGEPRLQVSGILINGKSMGEQPVFDLENNENNISISYACLSFKSNKEIVYSYKMDGLDSDWQTTTDLKKEYAALRPGDYTFRIKAQTSDGNSTEEQSVQFQIAQIWWQTLPAMIFYLLAGGLLLRFFYWRRIRLIEAKNEEENEINKKFAELELEALQAQMNPHFIFNAMQSIQNFIVKKDERTANKYMVRFSRLMRLFLESSKKKYISVKEEIQLLKFYVELEHLRFPDKFDYRFEIDDDLKDSYLEIAPMMLQPFVENAINHGLVQSKRRGVLIIRMKKSGNFLEAVIDDDGIGRAAARKLREESFKHHKSRGMQLVEGRRKVLNRLNEFSISLEVIDKKNLVGEAIGTRVELGLPLHEPREELFENKTIPNDSNSHRR